jgi:hypothetical protein
MLRRKNESRTMKKTNKQQETNKEQEEQKTNPIEATILDILQSKNGEQEIWLTFQDITDAFENKPIFIDYWNKSDEFRTDLSKGLGALETKKKIRKRTFEQESYFSSVP